MMRLPSPLPWIFEISMPFSGANLPAQGEMRTPPLSDEVLMAGDVWEGSVFGGAEFSAADGAEVAEVSASSNVFQSAFLSPIMANTPFTFTDSFALAPI